LYWIKTKVCDTPRFVGLTKVSSFLKNIELQIPKHKIFLALDLALRKTPIKWWATHKGVEDLQHCERLMQIIFRKK